MPLATPPPNATTARIPVCVRGGGGGRWLQQQRGEEKGKGWVNIEHIHARDEMGCGRPRVHMTEQVGRRKQRRRGKLEIKGAFYAGDSSSTENLQIQCLFLK